MQSRNTKKSVSLVEILVAAVVLSFLAGGLISMFIGVRRYIRRANERTVATSLAYSQSRALLGAVRADFWDSDGDLEEDETYQSDDVLWIDNIGYSWEYTVSGTDHDYREVAITVKWPYEYAQ